jgi:hypothetical protein
MKTMRLTPERQIRQAFNGSNSLPDLAARIRTEHEATAAALQSAVMHAMTAGDLLIEAKAQLKHGQWLPWLAKNCVISERTAQLYIKLAKHRATIEKEMKSAMGVADLTLNEAAALCVLAGRLEKLMAFSKQAEACNSEELVSLCVQQGFAVIQDEGYDPFYGRSEAEQREWILFGLFICDARGSHIEWLLQRPFQNVDEWLGPEGDKCRADWRMAAVPDECKKDWARFKVEYADKTRADIEAEIRHHVERHIATHGGWL